MPPPMPNSFLMLVDALRGCCAIVWPALLLLKDGCGNCSASWDAAEDFPFRKGSSGEALLALGDCKLAKPWESMDTLLTFFFNCLAGWEAMDKGELPNFLFVILFHYLAKH